MKHKRILAISDIHGYCNELERLLEFAKYNPEEDQLVICGDLVDRGNQNMDTLFYVRNLVRNGAVCIMGNHDKVAMLSMEELIDGGYGANTQLHVNNLNGRNTYTEFMDLTDMDKKIARNFLKSLPLYYEYDKYIFVHSGISPDRPIKEQDEAVLLWSREEFYEYKAYEDKVVVFGHTPVKYLNQHGQPTIWFDELHNDKIGIDCGCFFSGVLGCLEIDLENDSYHTYYVRKEKRQ